MKYMEIKERKKSRAHPWRRCLSFLLCLCMLFPMMLELGNPLFAIALAGAAEQTGDIVWGNIAADITVETENGVRLWDVSGTTRRYLEIPITINVSGETDMEITLPKSLSDNIRDGESKPECNCAGIAGAGWSVNDSTDGKSVIMKYSAPIEGGQHGSVMVTYTFDCWNVISEKEFSIPYTVKKGGENTNAELKGKIKTGHSVAFDNYFFGWGDSAYSLSGLGGADKYYAFVPKWSFVYKKYFGLEQENFDGETYVYDVAPILVKPTGQQPYNISGTITLDQGGEVIGGVYMMDSVKGSDSLYSPLTCAKESEGVYSFSLENNKLKITRENGKKTNAVVSGNLTDSTDNKNYTLYFLVRYPKNSLNKINKSGRTENFIELKANLSLTHTGVDSKEQRTATNTVTLYQGDLNVQTQIYWASYVNDNVSNGAGLTSLKNGLPATLNFAADFFCLNEARSDYSSANPKSYKLQAIIDLSYLNEEDKKYTQLPPDDYRISSFNLSLVDAPGSWSQDWNQYENGGGFRGTPNVGWVKETWGSDELAEHCGNIVVYGSTDLNDDDWVKIKEISASDVWAINQDRDFVNPDSWLTGEGTNYCRLKVEYDSKWTTALRVGYQLEIKPNILQKYSLENKDTAALTCWFNYMGFDNNQTDTANMRFTRYPVSDGDGWEPTTAGSIELARQYDYSLSDITGCNNTAPDNATVWSDKYSMRNFARAMLGTNHNVAGMIVTQALYDGSGTLVGDPESIEPNVKDSFCLQKYVTNVSEIVYNLSGALTNGASDLETLKTTRSNAPVGSPYKALKMRYYVLLPPGMKLNTDPDYGEVDENGAPKYHFWTTDTDRYLSANSAFYNNNSSKVVKKGDTAVPVSFGNVPGWKNISANGTLSHMYWPAAGSVEVDQSRSEGQLVVFERILGDWADYEQYNMWGSSTFFWGRGLSFSAVPEGGTGSLAAGDYTTHVWCQYLDENDSPISLNDFDKGTVNLHQSMIAGAAQDDSGDTLLYIPIEFTNNSASGASSAKISLNSEYKDMFQLPTVEFGKDYRYKLEYRVENRTTENVVLWTNIEQKDGGDPKWNGTVTGVDLTELKLSGGERVEVYVRTDWFDAGTYTSGASPGGVGWLSGPEYGWTKVDSNQLEQYDWSKVKAIAFSFVNKTFESGQTDKDSAAVYINMKAPDENELEQRYGKVTYSAVSHLIFSDSQQTQGGGTASACTSANRVYVRKTVVRKAPITLPLSGGPGTTERTLPSLLLCLTGGALVLLSIYHRRRRQTRRLYKTG